MDKQKLDTKLKTLLKPTNESKQLTTEGIVDGVLNHIKGILTKANQKAYKRGLADLAAESPEGKKAVDLLLNTLKQGDDAMARVEKLKANLL